MQKLPKFHSVSGSNAISGLQPELFFPRRFYVLVKFVVETRERGEFLLRQSG